MKLTPWLVSPPIVATYQPSKDIFERLNRELPEYASVLVHTDLPYPIYRDAKDAHVPELPEEIQAFA